MQCRDFGRCSFSTLLGQKFPVRISMVLSQSLGTPRDFVVGSLERFADANTRVLRAGLNDLADYHQ